MIFNSEIVNKNMRSISSFRRIPINKVLGDKYNYISVLINSGESINGKTIKYIADAFGCSVERIAEEPDFDKMNKRELIEWFLL